MEILAKKPDLKNAFDVMDLYASDPDKRRELEERLRSDKNYAYELAAKYEQGIEKGIEQGIEKGEFRKALSSAKKMLDEGFNLDQILRITGLTREQLKENGIYH